MRACLFLLVFMNFLLASLSAGEVSKKEEKELELKAKKTEEIKKIIDENNHYVVFEVDGMCCKTCSIGIGKKVCKIPEVDDSNLPKGVKVDRILGLLTIAIKKEEKANVETLSEAIKKAGYEPVTMHYLNEEGAIAQKLVKEEKKKE